MPQSAETCSAPTLEERFAREVESLWPPSLSRRALLAVSGGADSVALARLSTDLHPGFFTGLVIAHFHHHLRKGEADDDAAFVQKLADGLGLAFVRGDWTPESRRGYHRADRNLQAGARKARYEFLVEAARAHNCPVILTAHHAGDQVETLLHNLARGGGSGAFRGIRSSLDRGGIRILRPLLRIDPQDLRAHLLRIGQDRREDSSNASLRYRRNWIRRELIPHLATAYPDYPQELLDRWEAFHRTEAEAKREVEHLRSKGLRRTDSWVLPRRNLALLPREIRVEALRWFLRELLGDQAPHGWDPIRRTPLESLLDLIEGDKAGVVNLPEGIRARVEGGAVVLSLPGG